MGEPRMSRQQRREAERKRGKAGADASGGPPTPAQVAHLHALLLRSRPTLRTASGSRLDTALGDVALAAWRREGYRQLDSAERLGRLIAGFDWAVLVENAFAVMKEAGIVVAPGGDLDEWERIAADRRGMDAARFGALIREHAARWAMPGIQPPDDWALGERLLAAIVTRTAPAWLGRHFPAAGTE